METSATMSSDREHRYDLWRKWSLPAPGKSLQYAVFIGLNPSTADEREDDPTIRRCVNFAKYWGYDALCMVNLFSFRTPSPVELKWHRGEHRFDTNDIHLRAAALRAQVVVCAWGKDGVYMGRDKSVLQLLRQLGRKPWRYPSCLRLNKDGSPAHPLYLPKTLLPIRYT